MSGMFSPLLQQSYSLNLLHLSELMKPVTALPLTLVEPIVGVDKESAAAQLPPEVYTKLEFLLPFEPKTQEHDLYMAARVPNSSLLVPIEPLLAQPWDWTTVAAALPPQAVQDATATDSALISRPLNNNTSLSLEHFIVRVTGEPHVDGSSTDEAEVNRRETSNRFWSETMYARDWREGRVGWKFDEGRSKDPSRGDESAEQKFGAGMRTVQSPTSAMSDSVRSPTSHTQSSAGASPISAHSSSSQTSLLRAAGRAAQSSLRNELLRTSTSLVQPGSDSRSASGSTMPTLKRKAQTELVDTNVASSSRQPPLVRASSSSSSSVSNMGGGQPRKYSPAVRSGTLPTRTASPLNPASAGLGIHRATAAPPRHQASLPVPSLSQSRHPLPPRPQFTASTSAASTSTVASAKRKFEMSPEASGSAGPSSEAPIVNPQKPSLGRPSTKRRTTDLG